ncbi:hypothetical protein [Curtobacterium sp. MCBA15_012]|uniref:hypothetical protein n=1 Tax=Curtobacterium sp. MCBA15_012 TaxID=1898738 RepID=UPI0008DE1E48|nr:hypothetical protein [Curtobacterium sp. MCBA15_012]WIB00215.1 hypothetical protein QOL15_00570 [Curtobacterium sp. MCBA15_012]
MSRRAAPTVRRGVEAVRVAVGLVHLVLAGRRGAVHRGLHGVLAVRQLGQATVVARVGSPEAHTASAVVDVLHGATMVPLAIAPGYRRFAVGQAVLAVVLAVAEVAAVGRGRR